MVARDLQDASGDRARSPCRWTQDSEEKSHTVVSSMQHASPLTTAAGHCDPEETAPSMKDANRLIENKTRRPFSRGPAREAISTSLHLMQKLVETIFQERSVTAVDKKDLSALPTQRISAIMEGGLMKNRINKFKTEASGSTV